MTELISLSLLAFAVSVDSFGAGLTYGLRRLEMPLRSLLFISLCSGVSVLAGGVAAEVLVRYLPPGRTEALGGGILIFIGVWALIQVLKDKNEQDTDSEQPMEREKKGVLSQILAIIKKPDEADIDQSGTISTREAAFLGAALSLDALGAGIGASLIGLSPFILAGIVSVMCALFLAGGMKGGKKLAGSAVMQKLSFLPGLLLICLGIWNLY